MVQNIVKDVFFLGQKSEPATEADIQVGIDFTKKKQNLKFTMISVI